MLRFPRAGVGESQLLTIKVAEDDIAFKLAILKKSLHLNDNTCFLGERQPPPKVLYLRSLMHPPPPTHLVCNDHLIPDFLSFHMSLVVVMNYGAGNALRGFEIRMFYCF